MLGTKPAHSPMARFCHKIYSPNTLDHYSGAHFWEMLGTCAKDAFDLARMSSSRFFGPQGRIFTAMFLYQANSALADFRRKLLGLIHGSILSKVGASTKPGAVHFTLLATRIPLFSLFLSSSVKTRNPVTTPVSGRWPGPGSAGSCSGWVRWPSFGMVKCSRCLRIAGMAPERHNTNNTRVG